MALGCPIPPPSLGKPRTAGASRDTWSCGLAEAAQERREALFPPAEGDVRGPRCPGAVALFPLASSGLVKRKTKPLRAVLLWKLPCPGPAAAAWLPAPRYLRQRGRFGAGDTRARAWGASLERPLRGR